MDGNNSNRDNSRASSSRKASLKERLGKVTTSRWIRFGIVSLIFFLWVILMGNPWLLLIWLLLIDIYLTQYIPWNWWKSKTGPTRTVMAWVDAIVYALVLIYFIFAFVGQQYEIPSSSLEKSLLVGDRLWVDKTVYGARVPQTPLHFPLAQHTMPFFGTKSYIEHPQLEYHRLPGFRQIQRGDIVVFNYPQGDTVAEKIPNPDYYQICHELRREGISDPLAYMKQNPAKFGEIIVRPVDRRENYVKRAIGLPGERLKIVNDTILINGKAITEPENVQYNYIIPVSGQIASTRWQELGVRLDDLMGPVRHEAAGFSFYDVPLTHEMAQQIQKWPEVIGPIQRESETNFLDMTGMFPLGADYGWTRPNMGEIWIPQRGVTLHLTPENYPIYERAIRTYEGNDLAIRDGKIYINGEQTEYYTFKMDYYWMMGDNRDRSADSRFWGFVPEDHIVGSPVFIIVSLDGERSLTDGKIRWNRILANPNPDKSKWQDD
ncbi:MAG: S26 family signal peptidase [Muribaculaceae bacterium]|nr:S26 family signal peptidase [Muribaculaceae bacterium]